MSIVFIVAARSFAQGFVPIEVRSTSLKYIRISAFSALSSAIETAVASATRALDHPDVPLVISSVKFVINIVLDFLIISTFRVGSSQPTVNTQAGIRLTCDLTAAFVGLLFFIFTMTILPAVRARRSQATRSDTKSQLPTLNALKVLVRPGAMFFAESAIRNAL